MRPPVIRPRVYALTMVDLLVIVSKAVFEGSFSEAKAGDVLPLDRYLSTHKALEPVRSGGRLFLVTVRPPDERLWLVAVLENPRHDGKAWVSKRNGHPVTDLSALRGRIRFTSDTGISMTKGALGMSLQTPRQLTAGDVALMLGAPPPTALPMPSEPARRARPSARRNPGGPQKAEPAPASQGTSRLAHIIEGRMEQAIGALRDATATATADDVPELLRWLDLDKWRATEATQFWVSVFFLLMRFGEPAHLKAVRRASPHKSYSQMHQWLTRNRELVADVIELRSKPRSRTWSDAPLPKTRAQLMAHIAKRLGDPRWKQVSELVAFAKKPAFNLHGEEGLHLFAALLLHGSAAELDALKGLARQEPIFAQLLAAHGGTQAGGEAGLEQRLKQAVLAEPTRDEPRTVYADWLMERGDPRGEFIAAQLANRPVDVSLEDAVAWAGDVRARLRWRAPFANEKGFHVPRYARGFLSGAAVDALDGTSASADWATLEVLDVHSGDLSGLARYDLRSLAVLGGLDTSSLDAVLRHPTMKAQLSGLGLSADDDDDLPTLWNQLAAFPRLRFLALDTRSSLESLRAHPLFTRLEVVALREGRRLPKSGAVTVLGTSIYTARWLPHFDELQRRLHQR